MILEARTMGADGAGTGDSDGDGFFEVDFFPAFFDEGGVSGLDSSGMVKRWKSINTLIPECKSSLATVRTISNSALNT